MGNDIFLGVSFKSVCFDFFSTYLGISVQRILALHAFWDLEKTVLHGAIFPKIGY